jgi:hypothetical protein
MSAAHSVVDVGLLSMTTLRVRFGVLVDMVFVLTLGFASLIFILIGLILLRLRIFALF